MATKRKGYKATLLKVTSGCWSDDRGNDKSGFIFDVSGYNTSFAIDKKSKNGEFFSNAYPKMIGKVIMFDCDEWGYSVKFSKQTVDTYK